MSFSISLPDTATTINLASTLGVMLSSGFVGAGLVATYWIVPAVLLPLSSSSTTLLATSSSEGTDNEGVLAERQIHLARQWQDFYDKGKKYGPLAGTTASVCWIGCALLVGKGGSGVEFEDVGLARRLYVAGAVLSTIIAPYTVLVMGRVNGELLRRAAGEGVDEKSGLVSKSEKEEKLRTLSTEDLLGKWAGLNLRRVVFPVLGLMCVVYARIL